MLYDPSIPILNDDAEEADYVLAAKEFSAFNSHYVFNGLYRKRRSYIEDAYLLCKDYLDERFKDEIKLPNNFFTRLWELQLCAILIHKGYNLALPPKHKKAVSRPDFCVILDDNSKLWIEATCPQLGPLNPRPEMIPGKLYTREGNIFDDLKLSAPRIISSTLAKYQKLSSYKMNPEFEEDDKFVLAINTGLIDHHEPADMSKELVLYGMGLVYFKQNGESGRHFHLEILRNINGRDVAVPTALFHREEYNGISAVISSDCWFEFGEDYLDSMSERMNTYFNHNATNPLDHKLICFGAKHTMLCEGEYCELKSH